MLISNLKKQINDDFFSNRHKTINDNNKEEFDIPTLQLFDEKTIVPGDDNDEQHPSATVSHNISDLHNYLNKSPFLSDFMKIFLNHMKSTEKKESQRENLNDPFESPFDDMETIFRDSGNLINPFDLLMPGGFENHVVNKSSVEKPQSNIGEIYFVELGSNDNRNEKPIQINPSMETLTPRSLSGTGNVQPAPIQSIMGDFADSMKDIMRSLHEIFRNLPRGNLLPEKKYISPHIASNINISIHSNGETQFIPSNAYMNQNNYGVVNITWRSNVQNINNSLCFKLRQDESGNIVFKYMQLRIMEGSEIHEYKLKEPVFINTTNRTSNETVVIELTGRVGVRFISTGFLDVITLHKTDNYSTHWLVFSIAVLGLIVAGLIMSLSYIIFRRNQRYPRKGSISKEAIVY
ncbi:hypothetical protein WA026_009797 [Henosepilachna vigintioctopunctata]|uniref:Uncharacterized protein n=1 Tax=Henosepilachna vigintioctopunctata TaxID=420089 RepID=A0AAW1TR77_9CUCU